MKKALSCVLALILAFGMTTVAYAATKTTFISVIDTPFLYKDGEMVEAKVFQPGKTYYYPLENLDSEYNDGLPNILQTNAVSGLRVSKEINKGSNIFDSASIARRKAAGLSNLGFDENDYTLFLAVATKSSSSKRSVDVDYVFKLGASSSVEFGNDEVILQETFEADAKDDSSSGSGDVTNDGNNLYDFSDVEGRVIIEFDNNVTFTVYATKQKPRYLEYTDNPNDYDAAAEVDDKYGSKATLDFHMFLGKDSEKTFDTSGKLYFPAEKADYIYQISNNKLRGIEAEYDSDEGGFIIRTKTPGYYVISDKKLGDIDTSTGKRPLSETSESESSTSSKEDEVIKEPTQNTGGETNPDTGANDVLGLAMSLVVVSLACVGVVTFKKQTR